METPQNNEKEKVEGSTPSNSNEGIQQSPSNIIEEARRLREGLANDMAKIAEQKRLIEEAATRIILGGQTQAGTVQKTPEQIELEKIHEEADRRVKSFLGRR